MMRLKYFVKIKSNGAFKTHRRAAFFTDAVKKKKKTQLKAASSKVLVL